MGWKGRGKKEVNKEYWNVRELLGLTCGQPSYHFGTTHNCICAVSKEQKRKSNKERTTILKQTRFIETGHLYLNLPNRMFVYVSGLGAVAMPRPEMVVSPYTENYETSNLETKGICEGRTFNCYPAILAKTFFPLEETAETGGSARKKK